MNIRLLSKSRFKLALDCPTKLFYTNKKQYVNQKSSDPFLRALANGGFQVEEFARQQYPEGTMIEGNPWEYDLLVDRTEELLLLDNVIIFEAAFRFDNLFIRTDILIKIGNNIHLLEVKAKVYDEENTSFVTNRGKLSSRWAAVLYDLAFQSFVIQKSHPQFIVKSGLLLPDKNKCTNVEGLNQMIRIRENEDRRLGLDLKFTSPEELGDSVLTIVDVDDIITDIHNNKHEIVETESFENSIQRFAAAYHNDNKITNLTDYSTCKNCEFNTTEEESKKGLRSGFKECLSHRFKLAGSDFKRPTIFDIWNFGTGKSFFEGGRLFLSEIEEHEIVNGDGTQKLSRGERQWAQINKLNERDNTPYFLKEELEEQMATWKFPLNMIDFETSSVALPMHKEMRPYEQVAFQFSHHVIHEDGNVEHANEFLHFEAGQFPNYEFVRALKKALEVNDGTVFRYSHHENTILNVIKHQLRDSDELDRIELIDFIKSITLEKFDKKNIWVGERNMVDLCQTIIDFYYDPYFGGSNSIKVVLPAMMKRSRFIQDKYSKPFGEVGVSSLNFGSDYVLINDKHNIEDPYKLLPPIFEHWDSDRLNKTISELDRINEGGTALVAYGKLQYTDMSEDEKTAIGGALLKYCEIDTLAMVLVYEGLVDVIGNSLK